MVTAEMGKAVLVLSSELIRAARALLRWEQRDLASASSVSLPTIKRLESRPGILAAHMSTVVALKKALEAAGVEFIDENGGGPGVRLRKSQRPKAAKA
jgi:predicted transcriptional regulator